MRDAEFGGDMLPGWKRARLARSASAGAMPAIDPIPLNGGRFAGRYVWPACNSRFIFSRSRGSSIGLVS
jgi:hypothetical protein